MNRWAAFASCFLLIGFPATAQPLILKKYTVEDGLVSNPVRRIYQDKNGFMWIATLEGLSKYDGAKFTNYTTANGLSHNMVNDIYESPDGKLFLAENNGTVDILQHDAVFKKQAFQNVVINRFYINSVNGVLAGTDTGGLHLIKNDLLIKPSQQFPHASYNDITYINDTLLIGGTEGSLIILNRQLDSFAEIKKPHFLFFKVYKDSKKRIWVGTGNGLKLLSVKQTGNHLSDFTLTDVPFKLPALNNSLVNDIREDDKGNLWIGTEKGLVKINPDNTFQLFSEKDGLPSDDITSIYQDKEKNIWFGTSLGLAKLVTKNDIRIYLSNNTEASNNVSYLLRLKHDLFLIGTQTGTQLFNSSTNIFSPVKTKHDFIYTGFTKNSRPLLFFLNDNRFGKYDSIQLVIDDFISPAPPQSIVFCSVMDTNGIIFNGTSSGLLIRFQNKTYYNKELPDRVTDLLIDKKRYLWVATWDKGLYRITYTVNKNEAGNGNINISVDTFSALLPDKSIRSLYEDKAGNIWVGTRYGGIAQLKYKTSEQYTVQLFNLQSGLMSNWARAITDGLNGCIWIGTDLGIDKLIPAGNSYRVFNFSRINNYFTQINSFTSENNHSLWLSSSNGIANITDGQSEETPPPSVTITSVGLADTSFKYHTWPVTNTANLKYYQNQVKFEFSSPTFINEKQILYSYHLLGSADTAWSIAVNQHIVSYASLQPGSYRFEVRTIGWNGQPGVPACFLFIIKHPYWQSWWFYSVISLLLILLAYSLYRYRINQLLKLQNVRNRIASDLHDDIGATLTNINILSEISRKKLGQPVEAEKFLNRISEEVTATSKALNDIIWSVNSGNDTIEETLARMRRYAAELFDNSNTRCHLSMDENIATKKFNMEQRRDFFLIYKEAMNNIFKHAEANNIWIDVKWQNNQLQLKIKDDGKGFEQSVISHRNGLRNMRARTEKWKGHISMETARNKGTLIEITIPIAE